MAPIQVSVSDDREMAYPFLKSPFCWPWQCGCHWPGLRLCKQNPKTWGSRLSASSSDIAQGGLAQPEWHHSDAAAHLTVACAWSPARLPTASFINPSDMCRLFDFTVVCRLLCFYCILNSLWLFPTGLHTNGVWRLWFVLYRSVSEGIVWIEDPTGQSWENVSYHAAIWFWWWSHQRVTWVWRQSA